MKHFFRNRSKEHGYIPQACQRDLDLPITPNILIVDDEVNILKLISRILAINGMGSEKACSLQEAEGALLSKTYDVVFLDLEFPDGSGFTVLEKVMKISPESLVIVITSVYNLETTIKSMRKGAFDYITKPFSITLFQERLSTAVDEWKSRTLTHHYKNYLEKLVELKAKELSATMEHIDHVHDMTVMALGAALDLRDPETEDHCHRVSEDSVLLFKSMGMPGLRVKDLKWGSYLHDIGKIGIPEDILSKKGDLSDKERLIVEKHSLLGYSMIENIDFLSGASDVVLHHHEKYDGSGYPHRFEGDKIPIQARIFAVIDAFDAMVMDRPYRKALSLKKALEEIQKCSGTYFDPEIVDVFLKMPDYR